MRCQRFDYKCSANRTKFEERSADSGALSDTSRHPSPSPSLTDHRSSEKREEQGQTLNLFLSKGDKIWVNDDSEYTAVHRAAQNGLSDKLTSLLEYSSQRHILYTRLIANTRDPLLWTPLHLAILNGHSKAANVLLRYGAIVDTRDYKGRTALHLALMYHDLSSVALLLRHGAGVRIADLDGETALSWALNLGDKIFISMLRAFDTELKDQNGHGRQAAVFVPFDQIDTRYQDLLADYERLKRENDRLIAQNEILRATSTSSPSTHNLESSSSHRRLARGGHPITTRTCSHFPQHLANISCPQPLLDSPYSCTITANPFSSQHVFL